MSFSLSSLNPLNLFTSSTAAPVITTTIGKGSVTPQQAVAIAAILSAPPAAGTAAAAPAAPVTAASLEAELVSITQQIAALKGL